MTQLSSSPLLQPLFTSAPKRNSSCPPSEPYREAVHTTIASSHFPSPFWLTFCPPQFPHLQNSVSPPLFIPLPSCMFKADLQLCKCLQCLQETGPPEPALARAGGLTPIATRRYRHRQSATGPALSVNFKCRRERENLIGPAWVRCPPWSNQLQPRKLGFCSTNMAASTVCP